ncbi:MAG: DUF2815 family protein [Planctomycetota bacterium]
MPDVEKRVITPVARLSFPALFKPTAMDDKQEKKYSCELIFEPGQDLKKLEAAAKQALKDKWGDKVPKKLRMPFRSGNEDREDKDGYEDCVFIGARSKDRPGVVIGPNRETCFEDRQGEVYGGCYVKASVTAFAYDVNGNKGVAFALNNVWKIREGEPFGAGRMNAEDEFADEEVDAEAFGEEEDADDLLGV